MGMLRCLAVVLALVLALPSCRKPEAPPPPKPPENIYRLPLTDNPVTLDPARFTDVNSDGVARRIFNTLVRLDSALQPIPDLAESWQVSEDGRTYTFKLRQGVLFHNGRELTSDDVRYSFERLLRKDTSSHHAWIVEPIAGAREMREEHADSISGLATPDPCTVVVHLREPFGPFLQFLAMGNAGIVPKEELQTGSSVPFGRRPVGTGPFRFVSWRDNDVIELARNERYFAGAPKLTGIRFRVIKESLVAYREYLAGELEHCAVPEGYLDQVRQGPLKAEMQSTATLSTYYLGITMPHEPCGGSVHLRRALNYAIDRQFLCEKILGGSNVAAKGLFPPGLPGYDPDLVGYSYDIERAKKELARAGFGPGGRPMPALELYFNSRPPNPQVAQVIQADLQRVGIPLRLRSMDFGALLAATEKAAPDLFRLGWVADFPDADSFLYIFHSRMAGPAGNRVRYSNPEADALIDRTRREPDAARRLILLRKAERHIVEDAPWVFLSHGQTHLLVKPYVRNFALTPMDVGTSVNLVNFATVSLERQPGPPPLP